LCDNNANAHTDAYEDLGRKHRSNEEWIVPLLRGGRNAASSLATITELAAVQSSVIII
jgi:hypothetical protein